MIREKFFFDGLEPIRLDLFLKNRLKPFSRSRIQKAIKEGQVKINGHPARASQKLKPGDSVEFFYEEFSSEEPALKPERVDFEIIYEDEHIIIINKPAGLVVHPGAGISRGTLVHGLLFHFPGISQVGSSMRPGIVHRLDKETSGLLVVAKTELAYHSLREQFEDRLVKKTYLALVYGRFKDKRGIIDLPIGRHIHQREKFSVRTKKPRTAITNFEVLQEFPETTFLALKPITGRTHQLRVHLSAIGHPIVGDSRYGGPKRLGPKKYPRLFLHAWKLSLVHPQSQVKMEFECPLPSDLQSVLDRERAEIKS
ncbi:MAG: RluA family pseudouridine synthase [Candidatus Saccharicenans sp.]